MYTRKKRLGLPLRVFISAGVLALTLLWGCDTDNTLLGPTRPPLEQTPMADSTAELMAIYLSEALVAPRSLYQSISRDLNLIREQWGDSLAVWDDSMIMNHEGTWDRMSFRPRWRPSELILAVTDSAYPFIRERTHQEFGDTLAAYRGTLHDHATPSWPDSARWYVTLTFEGRLHPGRLAEEFASIEGVLDAGASAQIGGSPNILPVIVNGERRYCYYFAWGDCPSGCMYADFHYFRIYPMRHRAIHLGSARPRVAGQDETAIIWTEWPEWLDTAIAALRALW